MKSMSWFTSIVLSLLTVWIVAGPLYAELPSGFSFNTPSSMTLPTLDFAETALPGSFGSFSFDTSGGFGSTLDISLLPYSPINLSSIADLLFGQEEEIDTEEFLPKETFLIIGTIDYVGLEGGFYAIEGDDGQAYDPINLPDNFKRDGLRVRVIARPQPLMGSFHMYGQIIEIVEIEQYYRPLFTW